MPVCIFISAAISLFELTAALAIWREVCFSLAELFSVELNIVSEHQQQGNVRCLFLHKLFYLLIESVLQSDLRIKTHWVSEIG